MRRTSQWFKTTPKVKRDLKIYINNYILIFYWSQVFLDSSFCWMAQQRSCSMMSLSWSRMRMEQQQLMTLLDSSWSKWKYSTSFQNWRVQVRYGYFFFDVADFELKGLDCVLEGVEDVVLPDFLSLDHLPVLLDLLLIEHFGLLPLYLVGQPSD